MSIAYGVINNARAGLVVLTVLNVVFSESTEWLPVAKIQKQQWLAEIVGCFHKFLFILLQNLPGKMDTVFLHRKFHSMRVEWLCKIV